MSHIPPSQIPPTGMPGSKGPDPEAQAIINYFQGLVAGGPADGTQQFAAIVVNNITQQMQTNPNPSAADVENWIQNDCVDNMYNLMNPSAHPSAGQPDLFMCFAEQGYGFDVYDNFTDENMNTINQNLVLNITSHFDGWQIHYSPFSAMDGAYVNMLSWMRFSNPNAPSPSMTTLLTTIINRMFTDPTLGSSDQNLGNLWNYVSSLLGSPSFFTTYANPPFTINDLNVFLSTMPQIGQAQYQLPEYIQTYLNLGYSLNTLTGPLHDLTAALLAQMGNGFETASGSSFNIGNNAELGAWLGSAIGSSDFLTTYKGITDGDIATVAQNINLTIPAAFFTYFHAIIALLPSDPTSPDYQMIADFQSQWITAMFNNPTTWNAQTWFESNYGTPGQTSYPAGIADLYMLFPSANTGTIQSLVNVFFPSTPYTETTWDTTYRTFYAEHGGESSGLYHDFLAACRQAGSSDQAYGIEKWIDQFAVQGFTQYPTMSLSDIMTFLGNFPFNTVAGGTNYCYTCDLIESYIQTIWIPANPTYGAFGQLVIAELGAQVTNFSSFQDLKTYVDGQIPNYEKRYPASVVTGLFALFGLNP